MSSEKELTHTIEWDKEKSLSIMGQRPLITKYNREGRAELTWYHNGEQMWVSVDPLSILITKQPENKIREVAMAASAAMGNRIDLWRSLLSDQRLHSLLSAITVDPSALQTVSSKLFHQSLFQCRGAYSDDIPPSEKEKMLMMFLMRIQFCTSIDAVLELLNHPKKQP